MSKIKRIKDAILIMVMALMIVFGVGIISYFTQAKTYKNSDVNVDNITKNDEFELNLTDLKEGRKSGKLYCVEHSQHLWSTVDVKYVVANIVEINGIKATGLKKDRWFTYN